MLGLVAWYASRCEVCYCIVEPSHLLQRSHVALPYPHELRSCVGHLCVAGSKDLRKLLDIDSLTRAGFMPYCCLRRLQMSFCPKGAMVEALVDPTTACYC